MARLRQLHPSNYGHSGNIGDEFSNVVRYLNAAEFGNKTLAELLAGIFDAEGNFDGPFEMRLDGIDGLQYRIGEHAYSSSDDGWTTVAPAASLRGASGISGGTVMQPFYATRYDVTATNGQTFIPMAIGANTDVVIYLNGILMTEGPDYTKTLVGGTGVTFTEPLAAGDKVATFRVLGEYGNLFQRFDLEITAPTNMVVYEFGPDDVLAVYLNGILKADGATADYVLNDVNGLVIFTEPLAIGDRVSIMRVDNIASVNVAGLMMEGSFVDPLSGFIRGDRVQFAEGGIPPAKVSGLPVALQYMPTYAEAPAAPSPAVDLWLDTSVNPARLMFWSGSTYLPSSGTLAVPAFSRDQAMRFLQVDGTGTALQWASVDLSALIRKTEKGAAGGVATLNANGRLDEDQLPSPRNRRTVGFKRAGALEDGAFYVARVFLEKAQIVGFFGQLDAGTATARITLNGTGVGSTFALGIPPNQSTVGSPIVVDGKAQSVVIGIEITAAAAASDLDLALVLETVE